MPLLSKGMCWKVPLASRWQPYDSHTKMLKNTERPSFPKWGIKTGPHFSSSDQNLQAVETDCPENKLDLVFSLFLFKRAWICPPLELTLVCNGPRIVTWELTLTFLKLCGNQSRDAVAPSGLALAPIWHVLCLVGQQLSWGESQDPPQQCSGGSKALPLHLTFRDVGL